MKHHIPPPPLFMPLPPVARSTDPAESHDAQAEINRGQRQRDVMALVALIRDNPGLTGSDLDVLMGGGVHGKASKRLTDAEGLGLIRRGPAAKSTATGKSGATWVVVEVEP